MATPAQIAERERIDPHVLDPANHDKSHLELARLLGCTATFVRLRRDHHFPERPRLRRPVKPGRVADPVDDGGFDPEWADLIASKPLPDADLGLLAGRQAPEPEPPRDLASCCRDLLAEWAVVVERHAALDWSAPVPDRTRTVPMPERRELAHAS